jgi:hypothetical protein
MLTPTRSFTNQSRGAELAKTTSEERFPNLRNRDPTSEESPMPSRYAKLPLTPWKPWAACFITHLMTLASL